MDGSDKVSVTTNCPSTVRSGEKFTVTLTISKNSIMGLARLQQFLPEGFIAEEIESAHADYSFEESSVRYNWPQLPPQDEFTISYSLTAPEMSGKKLITGVFVYLDGERTERLQLVPISITVSDEIPPSVERKVLSTVPERGEFRVELTIHPNSYKDEAKFIDQVPTGYEVVMLEAQGAEFTYENQEATFSWKNLPELDHFTVTYLARSGVLGPEPVFKGEFVYGKSKEIVKSIASVKLQPLEQMIALKENADPEPEPKVEPKEAVYVPVTSKGITFKVQISPTMRSSIKNDEWFRKKYNINSGVELTNHEGWNKYMIGSFNTYADAKALRNETKSNVTDAFVVAYEDGTRIPVGKAISNKHNIQ